MSHWFYSVLSCTAYSFKRNYQSSSSNIAKQLYPVPSSWTPLDPLEDYKITRVDEVLNQEEFLKVKIQFLTTLQQYKIKSVKRVQNPSLWEDYER